MEKVNWESVFKEWRPSGRSKLVTDENKINLVISFCEYVGANCWESIELFGASPLEVKRRMDDSGLSKNEVFTQTAGQISLHRKVWQVTQGKYPKRLTYEFPLVVKADNHLWYMKFQIKDEAEGLGSPKKVKRTWLDFHTSKQEIEVKYD